MKPTRTVGLAGDRSPWQRLLLHQQQLHGLWHRWSPSHTHTHTHTHTLSHTHHPTSISYPHPAGRACAGRLWFHVAEPRRQLCVGGRQGRQYRLAGGRPCPSRLPSNGIVLGRPPELHRSRQAPIPYHHPWHGDQRGREPLWSGRAPRGARLFPLARRFTPKPLRGSCAGPIGVMGGFMQ
jgi:hypothetical protein